MQNLIKKYGKSIVDQVIKNDDLTTEEVKDIEYLEDRIVTFLEWN
jgi:aspartate/tyrosine/aromatic aminotransferase